MEHNPTACTHTQQQQQQHNKKKRAENVQLITKIKCIKMSCDHRKYPLPPLHAIVAYNIVQSAAIYQEPLTLFPFHWIPRPLCIRAIENRSTISNIGSTLCDNINVNYPRQPKNNNLYYIWHTERKSEFRLYIFFPSFFINKLLIGYFFFFLLCSACSARSFLFVVVCL